MTIAVTGATGFVGRAVLDEAAERGTEVRALTRREQEPSAGVEWVRGDLADESALARLVEGARVVLHIAGVVNSHDEAGFVEGNMRGTERLVSAARDSGVARIVLVSSLAAREPGLSVYGRTKRAGERIVEESGLAHTIVRPPAVYGPRDTEMFQLFRAARWGIMPIPAAGRLSLINVADLARLLVTLVEEEGARQGPRQGRTFEPDDGRPGGWSHVELARAIGTAVGRSRVWTPRLSSPLLETAARFDTRLRGVKAKLTSDRARYIAHPDWVCSRARGVPAEIWTPRVFTPEGLRQTAAWYRQEGWL